MPKNTVRLKEIEKLYAEGTSLFRTGYYERAAEYFGAITTFAFISTHVDFSGPDV